jgi:hypothetical protein
MKPDDAKVWFGAAPPDLTLVARVRGNDWLYTYLRSFYADPTRPLGANNKVFPNVGMPNVLVGLQGNQVIGNPLVTLKLGRVAAHAVVGEGTRTILHGSLVGQVDVDLVQLHIMTTGGKAEGRQRSENKCSKELFHQPVTLSGTGLVFSILV